MKIKTTTALAAFVLSAAVLALLAIDDTPPVSQAAAKPMITKINRHDRAKAPAPVVTGQDDANGESDTIHLLQSADEESASLAGWKQRFDALTAETGDTQKAIELLRVEIDKVFSAWVANEIEPIAELVPIERYDKLDLISQSVAEGAAAIFDTLGLPGGRHIATAANARDLVAAEIQYAETAPDPESRLALLRLDRERQARLDEVVGIVAEEERVKAESELEKWYSQGLAKVFPEDALTFEAP